MLTKIRNAWNSLPHVAQAGIMLFVGASTGVIRHVLENPNACMTASCWKGYAASAVHAGVVAVVALYIPSNFGKQ